MNNGERADAAQEAVNTFGEVCRMDAEPTETLIGDLLCNLRHLCKREGISFAECDKTAKMHYQAEKGGFE